MATTCLAVGVCVSGPRPKGWCHPCRSSSAQGECIPQLIEVKQQQQQQQQRGGNDRANHERGEGGGEGDDNIAYDSSIHR
ncbi:hypothetical protein BHE74_00028418 [Ensete ventricosum]|nr:hypothetical protein BHE74_00028418 [Ensete ventricosum]